MRLMYEAYAKTIPGNYERQGMDITHHPEAGQTCTEEEWIKARRMEDPHYDWSGYSNLTKPKGDHPEYQARAKVAELIQKWDEVLKELEPMRRGP